MPEESPKNINDAKKKRKDFEQIIRIKKIGKE